MRLFKVSYPMFDVVEIVREHQHRCHICRRDFSCSRLECGIEDRYAVCDSPACIAEFEGKEETQ